MTNGEHLRNVFVATGVLVFGVLSTSPPVNSQPPKKDLGNRVEQLEQKVAQLERLLRPQTMTIAASTPHAEARLAAAQEKLQHTGRDYVAVVKLAAGRQTVRLSVSDSKSVDDDSPLTSWEQLDLLGLRAFYQVRGTKKLFGSQQWQGRQPEFSLIRWERSSRDREAKTN